MERVPVAESGGSAGGTEQGLSGEGCWEWGGHGRWGGPLTVIAGEDQGDVPATLQEGRGVQQLPLGADGADVGVQLQPVCWVVEQCIAVGTEGGVMPSLPLPPPKHLAQAANAGTQTQRVLGDDTRGPGAETHSLGLT